MTTIPDADLPGAILVLGATGYVGGRLVPELLEHGHRVRCLVRSPNKLDNRPWQGDVEVVEGDLLEPDTLTRAFDGADAVYYLVHSLGVGDDFEDVEQQCAINAREAAAAAGVAQMIYLGGLGQVDDELSPHLRSRHRVGSELAAGPVPTTELRAAVILGSGSASFEMLRGLVEVLPVMVTPRWVRDTKCQPIAISDVLAALLAVLGRADTAGVREIGGTDVVSYMDMMQAYAEVAGLRRRLIAPVPVLTPRLSSRWVDFVTTLPHSLAVELVESLQNDVVVTDRPLSAVVPLQTQSLRSALEAALSAVRDLDIPTRWTGSAAPPPSAQPRPWDPEWAGGTVLRDERVHHIDAAPERVMAEIRSLGGSAGWLGFAPLWAVRGFLDAVAGGVGSRRGRRHPTELVVGDTVDFFRVEEASPTCLLLRAEMKMPGFGWLQWSLDPDGGGGVELTQTASFVPKGLWGRLYWWFLVPFHWLIFGRMVRRLAQRAESAGGRALADAA